MVSFKANLIKTTTVQRIIPKENSRATRVAFVELKPLSNNDLKTLYNVSELWENNNTYAKDIYDRFERCNFALDTAPNERFFALTLQ